VDDAGVVGLGAGGLADALALVSAGFVSLPVAGFSAGLSVLPPASVEVVPFASALLLAGLAEE
jgi:hypothetical protein